MQWIKTIIHVLSHTIMILYHISSYFFSFLLCQSISNFNKYLKKKCLSDKLPPFKSWGYSVIWASQGIISYHDTLSQKKWSWTNHQTCRRTGTLLRGNHNQYGSTWRCLMAVMTLAAEVTGVSSEWNRGTRLCNSAATDMIRLLPRPLWWTLDTCKCPGRISPLKMSITQLISPL